MFLIRSCAGIAILTAAAVGFCQQPKSNEPPATQQNGADPADKSAEAKTNSDQAEATPEQLQEWVKDLAHQKFLKRQAASEKLVRAGVPGMQAAAKAARTEELELATRCMSVLTEGLESKSPAVRQSARGFLEELAKSENESVAQRARQALDTPVNGPPIPGLRAGVQMQQVRIQLRNGVRELTVVENGKESVISDSNGKDINITITETVNGQKKTQTYKAKDEEELKKNHPEAHALYSRFSGGKGARIQINGNVFGGNIFAPINQQIPVARRVINPFKAADLLDEVDRLREKLDGLSQRLGKTVEEEKPDTAELKRINEELKTATKRLREIRAESQAP